MCNDRQGEPYCSRRPLQVDRGGVIRVGGTRIPLETVVAAIDAGATPEEICRDFLLGEPAEARAVVGHVLRLEARDWKVPVSGDSPSAWARWRVELEGILETLEILLDEDLVRQLVEADEQLRTRDGHPLDEVRRLSAAEDALENREAGRSKTYVESVRQARADYEADRVFSVDELLDED